MILYILYDLYEHVRIFDNPLFLYYISILFKVCARVCTCVSVFMCAGLPAATNKKVGKK